MATKLAVILEDDLEGGPADMTVRFRIGGTNYEIDLRARTPLLSAGNSPYVEHAAGLAADGGTGRMNCRRPGSHTGTCHGIVSTSPLTRSQ